METKRSQAFAKYLTCDVFLTAKRKDPYLLARTEDDILDEMDTHWWTMSSEERDLVNELNRHRPTESP